MSLKTAKSKTLFFRSSPGQSQILSQKLKSLLQRRSVNNPNYQVLLLDQETNEIEATLKKLFNEIFPLTIIKTTTYKEARAVMKSKQIDLCFIDFSLWKHGGRELLKWIQNNKIKIDTILTSEKKNPSIAQFANQYGAGEYLAKSELNSNLVLECIYLMCYFKHETERKLFMPQKRFNFFISLDAYVQKC